jgi:hypothetical protein
MEPDAILGDRLLPYLYEGEIVNRNDPEGLGRVTVRIEGITDESAWASPEGAGADKWGKNLVPPEGANVLVQFVQGNPKDPRYRPGRILRPKESQAFAEFDNPDVACWGIGPFRLIIDSRPGQERATLAAVRTVDGAERRTIEFTLDLASRTNAARLFATTALLIEAKGLVDVKGSQTQIQGRVVTPNGKAIN